MSPPARLDPARLDPAVWAPWPGLPDVVAAIARDGDTARVVGGAVRNALLGEPVSDVDLATTARPETVIARARAAGLKAVPTGIDHGTITVVARHHGYEVTTLREDVETFGRHAVVRFATDWRADAFRRDFTINALYADLDGTIHDYSTGLADVAARRVRFIGDAATRIREDYLRILRFFRFHARYGAGAPDAESLDACLAHLDGLKTLSAERIGQEMLKLVAAPNVGATLALMHDHLIVERVARMAVETAAVPRLHALAAAGRIPGPDPALLVAALLPVDADPVEAAFALWDCWRLSNAIRDRAAAAARTAAAIPALADARAARVLLYRVGATAWLDGIALAAVRRPPGDAIAGRWLDWRAIAAANPPPRLPITGKDLVAAGLAPGPAIGAALARAEAAWEAGDFTSPRSELLARALSSADQDQP